ncbi:hypothetical protein [Nocardia camponoti]|uniref:Uncharacterized protein n=1 Tax=Nocardia camponoti TaxID=1616106 RepID=A0A917QBE9_9NOCA|nr:hypothetical protein [Nocardia camponoti]GGK41884.1 hypothetical protein GCM10011591_11700 [Nocardia camponoti]
MVDRDVLGVRELLGLGDGLAWLFVLVFEATVLMYMRVNFDLVPFFPALVALVIMGTAALMVTVFPIDPLPYLVTAFIVCAGPIAMGLTVPFVNNRAGFSPQLWTAYPTSYVLAMLVVRGRVASAWAGVVATAIVLRLFGVFSSWQPETVLRALTPVATVAVVTVFMTIIRPTQRSLRELRGHANQRAAREAALEAVNGERDRQLARLDQAAGPILARIAAGVELSDAEREQCRLLEAELRDALRAPQLVTDALSAAARGARGRGVEVTLLDDGGFIGVPAWVRGKAIDAAVDQLTRATSGSVTVRVLPIGRRWVATVLAVSPSDYRRTEIDTAGTVRVSS